MLRRLIPLQALAIRFMTKNPPDPKHIFTNPETNGILRTTNHSEKHQNSSKFLHEDNIKVELDDNTISQAISDSIIEQRKRQRRKGWAAILLAVLGGSIGYSICYKVFYQGEESFIPLGFMSQARPHTDQEEKSVNIDELKRNIEFKVFEKLSMHTMIKEEFGVPLRTSDGYQPCSQRFDIRHKDRFPGLICLAFKPLNDAQSDGCQQGWHKVPYLFKWRFGYKSLNFHNYVKEILSIFDINPNDLFQVINPNAIPGEFRYGYSVPKKDVRKSSLYLILKGEMALCADTTVIYRGHYDGMVHLDQVDLLRRENNELIKYVLFKAEE